MDELELQDKLIESQNKLIEALGGRIDAEKKISSLALELAESRLAQATSLVEANNALKDEINAKDAIISNKDKEIELLKKKKSSLWDGVKKVALGVAIGAIVKQL